MTGPITETGALISGMAPRLNPGEVIFAEVPDGAALGPGDPGVLGSFREAEGLTLIVEAAAAEAAGIVPLFRAAWITLDVHSALEAVGLTAAVSVALTRAGIPCNVVAAARHDHLFVPPDRAGEAVDVLRALAAGTL